MDLGKEMKEILDDSDVDYYTLRVDQTTVDKIIQLIEMEKI
jgi:hypothetical protein